MKGGSESKTIYIVSPSGVSLYPLNGDRRFPITAKPGTEAILVKNHKQTKFFNWQVDCWEVWIVEEPFEPGKIFLSPARGWQTAE